MNWRIFQVENSEKFLQHSSIDNVFCDCYFQLHKIGYMEMGMPIFWLSDVHLF